MSSIPSNVARVPNLLAAGTALSNIRRTSLGLLNVQTQLATGRLINKPSDDAARSSAIAVLDQRLERLDQQSRALQNARGSLDILDDALGEAAELVLEAKTIASSQVGVGTSRTERQGQAQVVNSLLENLMRLANRESSVGAVFAGAEPGRSPVEVLLGGYLYRGQGTGIVADTSLGESVRLTLDAGSVVGSVASRVRGTADLNPALTLDTRLADLGGAGGTGVAVTRDRGTIEFAFAAGPRATVDLRGADTAGDVVDRLTAAIRQYETTHEVQILGPGGVGLLGGAITIDVLATPEPDDADPPLAFFDVLDETAGRDLGLVGRPPFSFNAAEPAGRDADPRLTFRTPVASLNMESLGSIRLNNLGRTAVIDLSSARTMGDVKNLIEGAGLGVRVEINAAGTGLDVLNAAAAGPAQAMSVAEIPGNNATAERLGIRSYVRQTAVSEFNDGRGVQIVEGRLNPLTGSEDPALNVDFVIRLGDAPGTQLRVDLRPQDILTVGTVIDRINETARTAGLDESQFQALLGPGGNGIVLRQSAAFAGAVTVRPENNSPAAEQLGLTALGFDADAGGYRAADRAQVRVDNLFTHLIDLREALLNDDTRGITLAGEKFEDSIRRVGEARALVGTQAARLEAEDRRREDRTVLDQTARSQLRDLDFAEAAVRLNLLQTQLSAGLRVTANTGSPTLLDFLG